MQGFSLPPDCYNDLNHVRLRLAFRRQVNSLLRQQPHLSSSRYSAFMKPSRYESEHTLTRCKCWIAFTWLTALLGALPIVAKMEVVTKQGRYLHSNV